jgi:mono/diheme cytochrome c family protein
MSTSRDRADGGGVKRLLLPLLLVPFAACGFEEADVPVAQEDVIDRVALGRKFWTKHDCETCHTDGDLFGAPSLTGLDPETILMFLDGTEPHSGGVFPATIEDARNLSAFLSAVLAAR